MDIAPIKIEQTLQTQRLDHAQHCGHMPMGAGAQHLQRRLGRHQGLAAECEAHQFHYRIGQVGEIADGFIFDLAVFAVGASQQVGGVDAVFIPALGSDDVDAGFRRSMRVLYTPMVSSIFSDYIFPTKSPLECSNVYQLQ